MRPTCQLAAASPSLPSVSGWLVVLPVLSYLVLLGPSASHRNAWFFFLLVFGRAQSKLLLAGPPAGCLDRPGIEARPPRCPGCRAASLRLGRVAGPCRPSCFVGILGLSFVFGFGFLEGRGLDAGFDGIAEQSGFGRSILGPFEAVGSSPWNEGQHPEVSSLAHHKLLLGRVSSCRRHFSAQKWRLVPAFCLGRTSFVCSGQNCLLCLHLVPYSVWTDYLDPSDSALSPFCSERMAHEDCLCSRFDRHPSTPPKHLASRLHVRYPLHSLQQCCQPMLLAISDFCNHPCSWCSLPYVQAFRRGRRHLEHSYCRTCIWCILCSTWWSLSPTSKGLRHPGLSGEGKLGSTVCDCCSVFSKLVSPRLALFELGPSASIPAWKSSNSSVLVPSSNLVLRNREGCRPFWGPSRPAAEASPASSDWWYVIWSIVWLKRQSFWSHNEIPTPSTRLRALRPSYHLDRHCHISSP